MTAVTTGEIVRSNIMQRLYDALPSTDSQSMLSVDDLAIALNFPAATISEALRRLRRLRCVQSTCLDGEWRYGRKKGAVRPADSRGRSRR